MLNNSANSFRRSKQELAVTVRAIIADIELLCDRMVDALHGNRPDSDIESIGYKLSEKYDCLEDHDPKNADEALRAIRFCLGEIENQSEDPSLTGQVVRIARKNTDYLEQALAAGGNISYLHSGNGLPDRHTDRDRPD